ncbi:hypothetical protein JL722_4650 [Aureococcus anophagefferens]|nr:hypothetical protein JL722_4650 [Aureococcus anophagefferens]
MANQYFHKPENALKRANELATIGNKKAALQVLHDVLTAKKSRTWVKVFESIMFRYIDICVELQMHRHAKDGLHQYRNISQQQAPQSLEVVIQYLVKAAETRAYEAAAAAKKANLAAAAKSVADLDCEQTPESIMMSTMTDEGDGERSEREALVPWLKFLWETYRSVLDILRTNSKLEKVYHGTSVKAFEFCRNAAATNNTSRLRGWEGWTQEGVEMHLTTRFAQLEVASALELWTEGFRTVEDIHQIMRISKKPPKAKLMAKYYERLTKIFWVAGFGLGDADRSPEDDVDAEKNARMATLLGFATHPTRSALLAELTVNGALVDADLLPAHVTELYDALESRFEPLRLAAIVKPLLDRLATETPRLAHFAEPLARLAVCRLVAQLGEVYSCVTLDHFKSLLGDLPLDYDDVEKLLVGATPTVKGAAPVARLDYRRKCLRFSSAPRGGDRPSAVAGGGRDTLSVFGFKVDEALDHIRKVTAPPPEVLAKRAAERERLFAAARDSADADHEKCLARKAVIERRKEEQERLQQEKAKAEAAEKARLEEERKKDEERRLEKEARDREREKLAKMKAELQLQEAKETMKALGRTSATRSRAWPRASARSSSRRRGATKKQKAEEQRLAEQAKRVDYVTRALRLEELPVLEARYARRLVEDREAHDAAYERRSLPARRPTPPRCSRRRASRPCSPTARPSRPTCPPRAARDAEAREAARLKFEADKIARKVARARRRHEEHEEEQERLRQEEDDRAFEAAAAARPPEEAEEERVRAEQEAERRALEEERRAQREAEEEQRRAENAKLSAERAALRKEQDAERAAEREKQDKLAKERAEADAPRRRAATTGTLTAMRLAAPSLVATTSDSSDHGPKEAPLRDSPLSKAAAADRERHLNPKGTKEDPASGYVPEIPAPPSVNRCSGHRAGARSPKPPGDAGDGAAEPRAGRLGGRVGRALTRATREGQEEAVFRSKATDEREAFSHLAGGRYMCARLDKRCWLEVEDEKHRYAKNLRRYHYEWIRLGEPCGTFWRWLDGPRPDGSKVCLPTCARPRRRVATARPARRRSTRCARESPPKPAATSGAPGGDRQPRSFDAPRAATEGEAVAPEGYAPLNTGPKGWIFVLHDGAFYARKKGTSSGKQRFHHSSFFSGECVDAAGIVVAKDGVVTRLLPHSGHYRPRESHFARLLLYLRRVMGLDLDRLEVDVQRLLRVARPEHTKKMDTPHYWAASDALHFLTRKALAKSSNLLYAIENRARVARRRDLSLAVDLAETHRLPSRPVLATARSSASAAARRSRPPARRGPTRTRRGDRGAAPRGADGWWDGAEPPLLRGRDTAQEEARNDDGAADSSSDSDSDSDDESSDGLSPEDPLGLLRRFESGSKHSLSDLDEDSANELSTTPPNLGSFGGRAKLKRPAAPRPADDDDLDDAPDAGPVFADDLDDELGRLSLRRARRGADEDKRRPGSSRA